MISLNAAGAATLGLVGGGSSALTSSYNPTGAAVPGIGNGTAITTFTSFGSGQGLLVSPENVYLTFDYIGKEASYTNEFKLVFGSSVVFDTQTSSTGSTSGPILFDVLANPGAVPFYFQSVTNGNQTATNGGSVASGLAIAFACATTNVCYAFFDDGGAGPDKDWDDMVVRITATDIPTPLPAALPLFASGLGALGLVARRRKKKASASVA